ncbi:hypothetical protein ACFHW0_15680 [Micromonospora sp. LOL_025]|uniref:hypothetical protein n=1 Tax=Micromonospora sp. LOL_025 TaxID=3345413 RepID=UPI003A843A87
MARDTDGRQYAHGGGPCLDAAASGSVLPVPDLGVQDRWPEWAEQGRKAGLGSSVSIGQPIQEAVVRSARRSVWRMNAHRPASAA